jgi:ATP-dependent helicase HrpB
MSVSLPIDASLPELLSSLGRHPNAVLEAPTGAGKTTRVAPALLAAGIAADGLILLIEPRRLAARAAARWMAAERGSRLGDEIGYHVRFDRCASPQTRILAVTPGILLRHFDRDPYLQQLAAVIFDEFHERTLESDLGLALCRLVQQTVKPELRLLAMSATLSAEPVARYLGDAPVTRSRGRSFPVEIRYEPRQHPTPWHVAVASGVRQVLAATAGDLLVFLPGMQEIRHAARELRGLAEQQNLEVVILHGDLPPDEQDRALLPLRRRKIVLSTNVAETSVTVAGITGVVDTGLARQLVFDARVGLDRLQLTPISRASADQRAGRAGRTAPGVCLRLWSPSEHAQRTAETEPEIRRVDLAGALLQLAHCGETDMLRFPWLEPPPAESVERSLALLRRLGAIDEEGITPLGRRFVRLPVHPRLAALLVEGARLGNAEHAATAAVLLSERDPFTRPLAPPDGATSANAISSDLLDRIDSVEQFERHGRTEFATGSLQRSSARSLLKSRDQLLRLGQSSQRTTSHDAVPLPQLPPDESLGRALLAAFSDRLCRLRARGSREGVMVGGRGVRLAPYCRLVDGELLLAIDVDARQSEVLVRSAVGIQQEWLPAERQSVSVDVEFDPASERVVARRRRRFDDLLLEEHPAALPAGEQTTAALAAAAAERLSSVLPPPETNAGNYLLRLQWLREALPELDLPAIDDSKLRELLPWLCRGCRSFEELRRADWRQAFETLLTYDQRQAVEREAPERLTVPSGNCLALRYELGRPPVLAVRIQEIFGWQQTPRVARGRVAVVLELLAPNYRPQQITTDLASFWANTYAQVRKDLRGRYPKHAWPEDPLTHPPQRPPGPSKK